MSYQKKKKNRDLNLDEFDQVLRIINLRNLTLAKSNFNFKSNFMQALIQQQPVFQPTSTQN